MMAGFGNWIRASWDSVRSSLWLVPGAMFAFALVLAPAMIALDRGRGAEAVPWWLDSGRAADAESLVSTLLTAIITMASMAFSVTVVALSLAANNYGPRLIRLFRSDLRTQLVLGFFVLTIVYLLAVLRYVQGGTDAGSVPHVSVTLGVVLAVLCVLALLAFIQGVAHLIVADEVVRRVRTEFDHAIGELQGSVAGEVREATPAAPDASRNCGRIALPREGYVQSVDFSGLLAWAARHDVVVRLEFRPGDFVVDGDHKVAIDPFPADPARARREIDRFIASGQERTPTQDIEFAIRHLVEVALRALSPGINDPFTAIAVIDRIRGGLCRLAGKDMPRAVLCDEAGRPRIVRRVPSYDGTVDAALHQIRQAGASHPSVLIHMLGAIGEVAWHTRSASQRATLARHATLVRDTARRQGLLDADLADVERAFAHAEAALAEKGANPDRRAP